MIGETLGSYRVVQKIGTGGMGMVYLAVHPLLGRKAVIKLLLPQYSNNPQVVTRFFHEARASALIGHPGIIDIFDFGHSDQGDAYLVMEFLDGESLAARIKRERFLSPAIAVAIAKQVTSALAAAHQKGIVHRDLKPDNLFLLPDRDSATGFRVKVLDFGIAKLAREALSHSVATNAGATIGTPKYMSPEQCLDAATVDGRADVYSLGCILFEMICGRPPFRADAYAEMLAQHIATPPPAPSALVDGVPPELEAVLLKSLEKDLKRRYQSMEEMAGDLERLGAAGRLPSEKAAAIAHREPTEAVPEVTPAPEPKPRLQSSDRATILGKRGPDVSALELQSTQLAQITPKPAPPHHTPPPHLASGNIVTAPLPAMGDPRSGSGPASRPDPVVTPAPIPPSPTPLPAPPILPAGPIAHPPPSMPSSVVESSTTLGAAASEIRRSRPPGHRRAILPAAAIGVVLGLAGVAIAIAVAQDDRPAGDSRSESGPAGRPDPDPDPDLDLPDPLASPLPGSTPAAAPAPVHDLVTLRIESDPAGADVYRADDGVRLGKTPVIEHVPKADGEAAFLLRRNGFREAHVSIPMSRNGIGYVQLEKTGKVARSVAKPRKTAKPDTNKVSRKRPAPIKDGALDPFGE